MCQTLSLPWWSVTSPQCWSHVAHLVCVSDRQQDQRLNVPQVCRRGHAPPRCVSYLIGNVRLWSRRTVGGGSGTMRTGWPGFSSPGPWTDPFLEHRGSDLQIYLQNCVSCVEHVCQSSFFFSKCVLACFFNFYTSIYYSWRHWYISELAETFFCVILCL